jgi:fimbrial isopeptide formation D2 family protein
LTLRFTVNNTWVTGPITNTATYFLTPIGGTEAPGGTATETIYPPVLEDFSKDASKSFFTGVGDEIPYVFSFTLPADMSEYTTLDIVDFLPATLAYVPGSAGISVNGAAYTSIPDTSLTLSATEIRYRITGTALQSLAGARVAVRFTVAVTSAWTTGPITNEGNYFLDGEEGPGTEETIYPPARDFEKTASKRTFTGVGDEIAYTISLILPDDLSNYSALRIQDAVPTTMTYVPNSASFRTGATTVPLADSALVFGTGTISYTLNIATLPAGSANTPVALTLRFTVNNTWVTGPITNTATYF